MSEDPESGAAGDAGFGLDDLRALARQVVAPISETLEPYPGLRPYQKDEASLFFGRDSQIFSVIDRLATSHFIAVTGPSGCGKSSLIRAGVIPKLEQGIHAGVGDRWVTAVTSPGSSPIRTLAEAIHRDAAPELESFQPVRDMLGSGPDGLVRAIKTFVPEGKGKVLLLVDQFEEVFRYDLRGGEEEAVRYVNLLLDVLKDPDAPLFVILTMRTDYIGNCTRFFGLPEAINSNLYLTPRLTEREMREAITEPARAFDGDVAEDLCEELLRDIRAIARINSRSAKNDQTSHVLDADRRSEHDHLPLMQHALMRMWSLAQAREEKDSGLTLEVADYEEIGRLAGALNKHAEEIFGTLDEEQQQVCQQMFRRLTHRDIGHRDIRDPMLAGDMVNVVGLRSLDGLEPVVSRFSGNDSSFIRLDSASFDKETMIDIGHEALIRNWDRLQTWVAVEQSAKDTYFNIAQQKAFHRKSSPNWLGQSWIDENESWLEDLRARDAAAKDAGLKTAKLPSTQWTNRYRSELERAGIQFCSLEAALKFLDESKAHWRAQEEAERQRLEAQQALAEQQRLHAEEAQRLAETQRAQAEQMQKLAEQQTSQAEERQRLAEQDRQQAEAGRRRRTITAAVGVLAVIAVAFAFINDQRQKSELAQLESQNAIKEAQSARDKAQAQAQIELGRKVNELNDLRTRLSGLIAGHRTRHLRTRLELEQLTRGARTWRHRLIYNPLVQARFGSVFNDQRTRFVTEWDDQMQKMPADAQGSGTESGKLKQFYINEMRRYLTEIDRTPVDIHSSLQSNLELMPKAVSEPIAGPFSTFAVAPDGKSIAVPVQMDLRKVEIRRYLVDASARPVSARSIAARDLGISGRDLKSIQVRGVSFSPNSRMIMLEAEVTVPAPADDVALRGRELVDLLLHKFVVLDVETNAIRDVITLDREVGRSQAIALSADGNYVAIVAKSGTYVVCAVGQCPSQTVTSTSDNTLQLVVKSDSDMETIRLTGLAHQEEGRFLAIFESDLHTPLRVHELLAANREPGDPNGRLVYRLALSRHASPHLFRYCAESGSLVGISSEKLHVHAWSVGAQEPEAPACFWPFLVRSGSSARFVSVWKTPDEEQRWSAGRRIRGDSLSGARSGERVRVLNYVEALLGRRRDQTSEFEFPHDVVIPALDRTGDRIFTYVVSIPGASRNAPGSNRDTAPRETSVNTNEPQIHVWRNVSGHHLAHLAGRDDDMSDAFFGYDEAEGNALVYVPGQGGGQVRIVRTRPHQSPGEFEGTYAFDRATSSFLSNREGARSVLARQFSDHTAIETRQLDGGGLEISYQIAGTTKLQAFRPGELATDNVSDARVAALSDDNRMIAVPVRSKDTSAGDSEITSPPALLVWQVKDETLNGPRLMARVIHKSEVLDAIFLPASNYLVVRTRDHGIWLSAWRLEDLSAEICQRLTRYEFGTGKGLSSEVGVDVGSVCAALP